MKRKKIFNDPVYGFISIPHGILLQLIDHPYFQRLRRISQLGMTQLVYPGALHTRFHHALGALHLTQLAIDTLRSKGHDISNEELEAVSIGILLHDIGHGPFSHTLEANLVSGLHHEEMSLQIMNDLNGEFEGRLDMAIDIFTDNYPKSFLHQLISGQLDMDRMDYLSRDSFYTGVSEGVISYERILKMLDLHEGKLVVESKGIYSIEKFLIARRLMYWQVYMHKTVVAAEQMILKIFERAKFLSQKGIKLFGTDSLIYFLTNTFKNHPPEVNKKFVELDDFDVFSAIKVWAKSEDRILSELCACIVHRKLFKIQVDPSLEETQKAYLNIGKLAKHFNIQEEEAAYFIAQGTLSNSAYNQTKDNILILYKNGETKDLAKASDNLNVSALSEVVDKNFLCYHSAFKEFLN